MTTDANTPNKTPRERRRGRRYPAAELKAEIKVKKGLFNEWVEVAPCDYNKRGIAIEAEYSFQPEQTITLNVILKMDMGEIAVTKVEGIIRNRVDNGPHPRYGIEFDFAANRHMKSIDTHNQLGRIENILERSVGIRERISEQRNQTSFT